MRPRGGKGPTTKPAPTSLADDDLLVLGRELDRLRRRCRRLHRDADWASWSATVEEANSLAREINRMQPSSLDDLVVRYAALHWLLVEADDVIMEVEARRAFVAFGRALKRVGRNFSG